MQQKRDSGLAIWSAICGFPFTAQPQAPALVLAGACGWAVNEEINDLLVPCG